MKIEINNLAKEKIDFKLVRKVISAFGRAYKVNKNKEISLAFVDDEEIKKLNKIYRGLNQATDILSFAPLNNAEDNLTGQAGEDNFLGELVIDYKQIKRQAGNFRPSARRELIFVLAHGLLHLIGYNDKTEKGRLKMIKLGEEFIRELKCKNICHCEERQRTRITRYRSGQASQSPVNCF